MFKKFGMGMLAVLMAVGFSAFTAPKSTGTTGAQSVERYWYKVVSGAIPQNAPLFDHAAKAAVTSPCSAGMTRDCLRGFTLEQNTSNGPINASGDEQIKTNQQP